MTKHYVLIDNCSGYIWGEADAENPIEACQKVDLEIGCGEPREYHEVFSSELASNETGYHVFAAPNDWVWDPALDDQDQEIIATVEQWPLAAVVKISTETDQ